MIDNLRDVIREVVGREAALIEEYCEKSLTDPEKRGVEVYRTRTPEITAEDGAYKVQNRVAVRLSSGVPWGQLHQYEVEVLPF